MFSISSFDIISVFIRGSNIFLCIRESAVDPAAINPNGSAAILANIRITFLINVNAFYSSGKRSLARNSPDCTSLNT